MANQGSLGSTQTSAFSQINRAVSTGVAIVRALEIVSASGHRFQRLVNLGDPEEQQLVDLDQEPFAAILVEQAQDWDRASSSLRF